MRAARLHAPGDLRIEDLPEPEPGADEVKVRVRACSLCGTDLKVFRHGHDRMTFPRVTGHEIAGEIAATGQDVTGWQPGERVQVIAAIPCGRCAGCRAGQLAVCSRGETMGCQRDGGFAEYVIVPAAAIAAGGINRIPPHVGFAAASMTEPLACVLKGQERIAAGPGDDVVVLGAGPIGCLHVRLARARGAGRVFLVDISRPRLDVSAALTAPDAAICADGTDVTPQILELTGGRGADIVIVAAASGAAYEQALRMAARRGSVSYFAGLPHGAGGVALDAGLLHYRELSVTGSAGASPADNTRALGLIAAGVVEVSDLITHRLPLGSLPEAIDLAAAGTALKVTIEP